MRSATFPKKKKKDSHPKYFGFEILVSQLKLDLTIINITNYTLYVRLHGNVSIL